MWRPAGKKDDWEKNSGKTVEVAGQKVALFNVGGKFYALADTCIHRGGPLGEGHLENGRVTCPWHAWEFDVTTGACRTMEGAKQKTYPAKVKNDQIFVRIREHTT